ncbi:MAG: xanthine dehydrogenase family protein molybdopterin-binding subunit [Acidimicrobiales bacterium]
MARFIAEVDDDHLAGAAHVGFARSPYAHARLLGVDTAPALAVPGVIAAFSAADLDVFPAGRFAAAIHSLFAQPLLAEQRVRFAGEPVAVVVAESRAAAEDGIEAVEARYEPLPPVLDLDDALAGATALFDPSTAARLQPTAPAEEPFGGGNVVIDTGWRGLPAQGEPDPFVAAPVVVRQRVMNPRQSPAPIECRGVACVWLPGPDEGDSAGDSRRLLVYTATQRPHGFRDELAALYRVDPARVTVVAPAVGGGFGGKTSRTPEERIMPFLARRIGRPVIWVETRSEYMAASNQGRGERVDLELAGTADGRILALRGDLVKDAGAYPITGAVLPGAWTAPGTAGCYDVAHIEFRARSVATNRAATSAFRGAGRAPWLAALERVVDLYAARVGLDPAEVRRRNLVRPDQMPYRSVAGATYDQADYPGDLDRALELAGYDGWRAEQARRREAGDPVEIGVGIACYNHLTVGGGGEEAAVTLVAGGGARVVTGSTSQGHGHATTWAQIAADVLGMPVDRIEVLEGSTELTATGVGAVGSRSLQTAGVAVHRAATEVVAEARLLAADLLEASVDDIVLDRARGAFHVVGTPARSVGWAEVAAEADTRGQEVSCGDVYDNEGRNTFPSGTHVAVVEVDTETGRVRVVRFVGVDDAGVRVNPAIVEGQLHGGIAAGIGQALGEEMVYDAQGNLLTSTFVDYQIVTADLLPSFELAPSAVPSSFNDLGFKAVGESGTIGATPAVHNAVLDALRARGVEHLDIPLAPERIWAALAATGAPPARH